MKRRDVVQSLPLLAAAFTVTSSAQNVAHDCKEPVLTECKGFPFDALVVRHPSAGASSRQVMEGRMPGLNIMEIHETTLRPGSAPHPPHRHADAEFFLVREGLVEFLTDNAPVRLGPGGVAYCAPNKLHGIKNVGAMDATYFVMKVGDEQVCQK